MFNVTGIINVRFTLKISKEILTCLSGAESLVSCLALPQSPAHGPGGDRQGGVRPGHCLGTPV